MDVPTLPADVDGIGPACLPPDTSNGVDSAYQVPPEAIANGTPVTDTLCPRADDDYWHISVTGARQIVRLTTTYQKSGSIRLGTDWFGRKQLCVPTAATTCSQSSECTGQQCDTARGGCRPADAPLCYTALHCAASESCVAGNVELLAKVVEPGTGTVQHRLATALPAFLPGDYYARIYDEGNVAEDADVPYELTIQVGEDPDLYEPNNTQLMATPLNALATATGANVSGFFSYVNDEDWYVLDPSAPPFNVSTAPILNLSVTWVDGSQSIPTWTVSRGSAALQAPAVPEKNGTTNALKAVRVLAGSGPIYIHITNTNGAIDEQSGYTLTVSASADATEGATRNDTPADATIANMGTPGGTQNYSNTIAAQNDEDWYRIDRGGGTENTLLQLHAAATNPATAPYLLDLQLYLPSSVDCPANGVCMNGGRCLTSSNKCLTPWSARPSYDQAANAPETESREFGGPTPNILDLQVPLYSSGTGILYAMIRQIPEGATRVAGYSATETYSLVLTHKAEPDLEDQNSEDNCYVGRPLYVVAPNCLTGQMQSYPDGIDKSGFFKRARAITPQGGWSSSGGTSGQSFALLNDSAGVAVGTCTALSLGVFDDHGSASSGSFAMAAANGSLWLSDTCAAGANPVSGNVSLPGTTVYYAAPATAPAGSYDTLTIGTIPSYLPVYDTTAPARITLSGARSATNNLLSGTITATLSAPTTTQVNLRVELLSGTGGSVCHAVPISASEEACPDIGAGEVMTTPPGCPGSGAGSTDCQLPILTAGTNYGFHVVPSSTSLVVVRVTAVSGSPAYVPATWVIASSSPSSFAVPSSTIEGFISYEGDVDFFAIKPLPSLGDGNMQATLTFTGTAGLVALITRDTTDSEYCYGFGCGVSVEGSSCTPCNAPADGCAFTTVGGSQINITVYDQHHDQRDERSPQGRYAITVSYEEGCPAACSQFVCASGN